MGFGCEAYKVYSDVEVWLSPGQVNTVKVDDPNGDFHFAKRKLTGTWVNSPIFIEIWKAIRTEGLWASHDWTVKVGADTVFLPMRLRTRLSGQKVTSSGIYLENCKYVNYGFFGNLEVVSHQGFGTFLANLDDCVSALNWKGPEEKCEVETELCAYLDGWDAPFHEAFRLLRVSGGHAEMRRRVKRACKSLGRAFEVTRKP